jgi:hypothetical protein
MCVRNPDCCISTFGGWLSATLGLCLQQSVSNTCELTFIAKEGEQSGNQEHQFPKDELRSPPMINMATVASALTKKKLISLTQSRT